jgi:hypothetical protein
LRTLPDLLRRRLVIIDNNYERNTTAQRLIEEWKECHEELPQDCYGGATFYTDTEPYWDLIEMGQGILAHVCVGYYEHWAFWFELLHELRHGRMTLAHCYSPGAMKHCWFVWFVHLDHHQAPEYIPTELDRKMKALPADGDYS